MVRPGRAIHARVSSPRCVFEFFERAPDPTNRAGRSPSARTPRHMNAPRQKARWSAEKRAAKGRSPQRRGGDSGSPSGELNRKQRRALQFGDRPYVPKPEQEGAERRDDRSPATTARPATTVPATTVRRATTAPAWRRPLRRPTPRRSYPPWQRPLRMTAPAATTAYGDRSRERPPHRRDDRPWGDRDTRPARDDRPRDDSSAPRRPVRRPPPRRPPLGRPRQPPPRRPPRCGDRDDRRGDRGGERSGGHRRSPCRRTSTSAATTSRAATRTAVGTTAATTAPRARTTGTPPRPTR